MRKIHTAILTAVLATTTLGIGSALAADVTVGSDFMSAYVWRGLTFNDEGVMQPSLDVAHESGVSINVWGNLDFGDYDGAVDSGKFSEVDLSLGYTVPVEGFDLALGVINYMFPQAGSDTTTSEAFVSAGISLTEKLSVGLDVYYDFDQVDDFYGSANVGYSLPLNDELALDLGASIGAAGEDFAEAYGGSDGGLYDWNVSASTTYTLSEALELGAMVAYTDSVDSDTLPDQDTDVYAGGSVYYSF